jgi:hypothetical protein
MWSPLLLSLSQLPQWGGSVSTDDCCTKQGLLPLTLDDGTIYYQPFFYCKNAVETIVSPQAILAASEVLVHWTQTGHKDGSPGKVRFESESGLLSFTITLENRDGLYYCPSDVFTVEGDPSRGSSRKICRTSLEPPPIQRRHKSYEPVLLDRTTESKLWMLRLGSPGEDQLDLLPGNVTGIPKKFDYHPFQCIDWKEKARVQRQKALKSAERTVETRQCFYMDFGFMRASSSDYGGQDKSRARVIKSWDGYSLYLLIVDEASRFLWVFLTKSKEPPLDIVEMFLGRFGHADGGVVRTDQGGELVRSSKFCDTILRNYQYVIEPMGADSRSQNGAVEIYNGKLAVRARTLLFGSSLPAKFWLSAMLHAVYLHNRLVHTVTRTTPFEFMFGIKPDLSALKIFGSRVCIKRSGKQRSKLDCHDF